MKRGQAWYRYQRCRAIKRKTGILRRIYGEQDVIAWTHGHRGILSNGKIHCSCWICRRKSCDAPSMADRRKRLAADQRLREAGHAACT